MKPKHILFPLLCCIHSFASAQLKIDKQHYIDLLNDGSYDIVYSDIVALQRQPYGKCCLTDYFIAKSLCLSGLYKPAKNRFENMLGNYKLPQSTREFLTGEQTNCIPPADVALQQTFNYINNYALPTSSVRGKLGAVFNCFQSYAPVKTIKEIPDEEFSSRLFSLAESGKALAKIKSIIPSDYSAENKDNFILVIKKNQNINASEKDKVIDELKKTLQFYATFYQLRLPDKLLTAYIVPDNESLRSIAAFVHGIEIPKENYGYSSLNDLSLLGISNSIGVGTLKHELFHLMVRADIGDIPAWLDEGIATLYEESHWEQDTLKSNKNFWRTKVLEETLASYHLFAKLPDLENLINYSWNEFEGAEEGDICKASVNYCFAKHFIVYLEQTGQLKSVLTAYKNRQNDNKTDLLKTNSEIFEQVTGRPVYQTEVLFDQWLKKTYNLSFLNPDVHSGERIGIEVFLDLKKNIREAKIIYDHLQKANDPKADVLLSKIRETETLVKKEITEFDKNMKVYALEHGGQINEDYQSLQIGQKARDNISVINRKFYEFLRAYK